MTKSASTRSTWSSCGPLTVISLPIIRILGTEFSGAQSFLGTFFLFYAHICTTSSTLFSLHLPCLFLFGYSFFVSGQTGMLGRRLEGTGHGCQGSQWKMALIGGAEGTGSGVIFLFFLFLFFSLFASILPSLFFFPFPPHIPYI